MNTTPTSETDAQVFITTRRVWVKRNFEEESIEVVPADFAKNLEQERDQAKEDATMLRNEWNRLNKEMENDERIQLARKAHLDAVNAANSISTECHKSQADAIIAKQELAKATKENEHLRRLNIEATRLASTYAAALHQIANSDYRGNRSPEAQIAFKALNP